MAPPAGYVITPSNQQPKRSVNDTAEFRQNYGANEFVNALYALDHGYTGQGVTVAVIDNGVNTALSAFAGAIDTADSKDFGTTTANGVTSQRNVLGDSDSNHGTPVAAIIGARQDNDGTVGYAPNVKIAVLRIDDKNNDTKVDTFTHAIEALNYASAQGLKLVNASFGTGGSSIWGDAVTAYGNKTNGLVIQSAGNASGTGPADAAAVTAANRSTFLFVVAYNGAILTAQSGLASYSNTAGPLADRTVTAPGGNVTTMVDGSIATFGGTSSAAPVVTALAADILSKWPQLTGQQAGQIIINTAKPLGDTAVYGAGMVDFQAALAPVNPTLSSSVTAKPQSVAASSMVVAPALSVVAIKTAISNVTVLDQFGRNYTGSLAGYVFQPEQTQGHWLRRRLEQMGSTTQVQQGNVVASFGFAKEEVAPNVYQASMVNGHMAIFEGGFGFHADWNGADSLQSDVMGLAPFADGILAYVPQMSSSFGVDRYTVNGKYGMTVAMSRTSVSRATAVTFGLTYGATDVRFSMIDESGTIMGVPTGSGGLALGRGAQTAMFEAHHRIGTAFGWSLEGYGSVGVTRLKIDQNSLVTGATALVGSRLGVQASAPLFGGALSFGVAQPLRIESGSARVTAGTGYDLASQSLTYGSTEASLSGARQVQLTAGFSKGGPRSTFRLGASQNLQDHSVRALAGWTTRF